MNVFIICHMSAYLPFLSELYLAKYGGSGIIYLQIDLVLPSHLLYGYLLFQIVAFSGAGSEGMILVHQLMLLDSHECVCMQPLKGIH